MQEWPAVGRTDDIALGDAAGCERNWREEPVSFPGGVMTPAKKYVLFGVNLFASYCMAMASGLYFLEQKNKEKCRRTKQIMCRNIFVESLLVGGPARINLIELEGGAAQQHHRSRRFQAFTRTPR